MSIGFLFLSMLAGYGAYWLSLFTPGGLILRPFLGCGSHESLKSKARTWFWGWVAAFALFLLMAWSGVGIWQNPKGNEHAAIVISVLFIFGVVIGYMHFLQIPKRAWERGR
jgi:hypothetical protein